MKFALGLLQLGLGFGALWLGAETADERGMVNVAWLLLGYLLHTTGRAVRLAGGPLDGDAARAGADREHGDGRMVHGHRVLAVSRRTDRAAHGRERRGGRRAVCRRPPQTVHLYGDVFGQIAVSALSRALVCFALSPLLVRWMHLEAQES